MTPRKIRSSHHRLQIAVLLIAAAALLCACCPAPAAAQTAETAADADAAARESWGAFMAHYPQPDVGCFTATYPNLVWEQVECKVLTHPQVHPTVRKPQNAEQTAGNGNDYVAEAAGLISETLGTFPKATGITSEKSVGVPEYGDGGILGANEYSIQLNTQFTSTSAACAGHSGCTVWQQFIYATDYETKGEAAVFMQYWLIGWGRSRCPSGFGSDGEGDCYGNSNYVAAPDIKATGLGSLTLAATATKGGNDTVVFHNGSTAYSVSGADSKLDIATVWKESEYNIVGDAGGSEAVFNSGTSITVKVALTDGSTSAPTCVANDGTTGESNNLNLGSCSTAGGSSPYIQFTESN